MWQQYPKKKLQQAKNNPKVGLVATSKLAGTTTSGLGTSETLLLLDRLGVELVGHHGLSKLGAIVDFKLGRDFEAGLDSRVEHVLLVGRIKHALADGRALGVAAAIGATVDEERRVQCAIFTLGMFMNPCEEVVARFIIGHLRTDLINRERGRSAQLDLLLLHVDDDGHIRHTTGLQRCQRLGDCIFHWEGHSGIRSTACTATANKNALFFFFLSLYLRTGQGCL